VTGPCTASCPRRGTVRLECAQFVQSIDSGPKKLVRNSLAQNDDLGGGVEIGVTEEETFGDVPVPNVENSGVVPAIVVVQFWSSTMTAHLVASCGAARRTASACVRMARRSSQVSVGSDPNPPETPPSVVEPDRTTSTFVPMAANTLETCAFALSPTATIR
jgi:hypothetical protein